jgi:hypothetical protein
MNGTSHVMPLLTLQKNRLVQIPNDQSSMSLNNLDILTIIVVLWRSRDLPNVRFPGMAYDMILLDVGGSKIIWLNYEIYWL